MKANDMTVKQALKLIQKLAENDDLMEILGDSYGGADISHMFQDFVETLETYRPESVLKGERK